MKPKILVARAIFPDVIERLTHYFDVETNQANVMFSAQALAEKLADKEGTLTTASEHIDAATLVYAPKLKVVANMAVGYNNFDIDAMTASGVMATNTPDVLNETTADFGWALLMATARRITESERWLREGHWSTWRYDMFLGADLHGSTLGIIGMGRIGQAIARRAAGFNMRVVYHNRSRLDVVTEAECKATYVDKDVLLQTADHVMLVLPYSKATHHTIGAAELAQMKSTATLINLARGGIVDDAALAQALADQRIAAAGLDVFEGEPTVHPALLQVKNIVLTPHIASASVATRRGMANLAADNLIAALGFGPAAGRPPCLLNPSVLGR